MIKIIKKIFFFKYSDAKHENYKNLLQCHMVYTYVLFLYLQDLLLPRHLLIVTEPGATKRAPEINSPSVVQ